jgi:ribose transport system permease protein
MDNVVESSDTRNTESSTPPDDPRLGRKQRSRGMTLSLERYAGVLILVAIIVIFTIAAPSTFPTYSNFVGILGSNAILGIVSVGLLVPLAAGVFDISVGGIMTLSVVAVPYLFQSTQGSFPVPLAIAVAIVGAMVIGQVNWLLVMRTGVDPFIATIGTGSVAIGISQLLGNGTTIANDIPSSFTSLGRASVGQINIDVFVFLALCVLIFYVFEYTPFGRQLYATGAAREAARLTGIRTTRVIAVAYTASAACAAIAGVLWAAGQGGGPPDVGDGYLIGAYSGAFLGATIIRPGRFNVGGLVVGILILSVGVNGLQLVGLPFWVVETFQGVALLVAVSLGLQRGGLRRPLRRGRATTA